MSLKEDVKNEIDNLPTLDEVKGEAPAQNPEPAVETSAQPVESEEINDVDDIEVDELPDLEDLEEDGGEEEEEQQASATEDEKRYTKKQLERKIEKRVAKEKRARERLERQLEETKQAQMYAQPEPQYTPEPEPSHESQENISPQEYARQAMNEQKKLEEQQRAQQRVYNDMISKGSKKYKDFEQTVNDGRYSQAMVATARLQPNAEDVLYYLGKKPDVAYDIAYLSPEEQAAKVTKIAHQLAQRQSKKRVSQAPEPIDTPKASNTGYGQSYLDALANPNLSLKELAAMRQRKA